MRAGGGLFEGLDIWKDEKYRGLQGTYPVIFLSFAKIKQNIYEGAIKQIEEKNYDEELIKRGVKKENIHHYGFAFKGKEVLIDGR